VTTIDFANLDLGALRKSVSLEERADLLAATGNFVEAAALMKEANRVRQGQFGPWNPNELRDFTRLALTQTPSSVLSGGGPK
jgi:hypothetical protein